jgi:tripartite-type tricarboxylate transporter receptor subunit TctC
MMTSAGITIARVVSKDAPFDPVRDFAGITRVASAPHFLIAHPDLPAKSLKQVVDLAKASPGTLRFSSPGLASTTFISAALLRKAAGIDIAHVPFRSAPEAMTAVIRGDVQLYFAPTGATKEQSEAGRVNPIAVLTPQRVSDLPHVPTVAEAAFQFSYDAWFGLMAPTGTPQDILDKISKDWADALRTPDVQAKLKAQFLLAHADTPPAMDKIVRDETNKLGTVFMEAGIGK